MNEYAEHYMKNYHELYRIEQNHLFIVVGQSQGTNGKPLFHINHNLGIENKLQTNSKIELDRLVNSLKKYMVKETAERNTFIKFANFREVQTKENARKFLKSLGYRYSHVKSNASTDAVYTTCGIKLFYDGWVQTTKGGEQ